jgi:hypothetical protein
LNGCIGLLKAGQGDEDGSTRRKLDDELQLSDDEVAGRVGVVVAQHHDGAGGSRAVAVVPVLIYHYLRANVSTACWVHRVVEWPLEWNRAPFDILRWVSVQAMNGCLEVLVCLGESKLKPT